MKPYWVDQNIANAKVLFFIYLVASALLEGIVAFVMDVLFGAQPCMGYVH
jgi:hypothetical protein